MLAQGPVVTFISDMDFWAPFQPHSTDGCWREPGNLVLNVDTNDLDVPLGLGTREMGSQKDPEEQGPSWEDQRSCMHVRYKPWDFQSLESWHSVDLLVSRFQGPKQSEPGVFLIK